MTTTTNATNQLPLTPYAGTSGWSGSDTSRDRAVSADRSGATARRQSDTLAFLRRMGAIGATWKEIAAEFDWHHGQASGVLSVLHKEDRIKRLSETRLRCKVYVHPDWTVGRACEPYQRNRPNNCPNCGHHL